MDRVVILGRGAFRDITSDARLASKTIRSFSPQMEQHACDFSELADRVVAIDPQLPGQQIAFRAFCKLLTRLVRATDENNRHNALQQAREEIESIGGVAVSRSHLALKFACSVIVDIVAQ